MRYMLSDNRTMTVVLDCKSEQVLPDRNQCIRLTSLGGSLGLLYYRIGGSSRGCIHCGRSARESPQSGGYRHNNAATIGHLETPKVDEPADATKGLSTLQYRFPHKMKNAA